MQRDYYRADLVLGFGQKPRGTEAQKVFRTAAMADHIDEETAIRLASDRSDFWKKVITEWLSHRTHWAIVTVYSHPFMDDRNVVAIKEVRWSD